MNPKLRQYITGPQSLLAALAITALAAIGSPGTASANSTANTTILNVVRVDYKDASGTNPYAANASTSVTVNLVPSSLNASGAPTGADGNPGLSCLGAFDAASGSTISALYALTASANGQAAYTLAMANTPNNVNPVSVVYNILKSDGSLDGLIPANPNPATRVLGSAIPTRVVDASTLEFPGGALAGFAIGDIVIVQTTGGKKAFLVTGVNPGFAPTFTHGGDFAHTDDTGAYSQVEVKGTLILGAYADQTITLNTTNDTTFGGGGTAPDFLGAIDANNAATTGVPVGEMVLVKISVTASTDTQSDGTVDYTLTASNGATPDTTIPCTVGTFKAPTLSIKKEARNTASGGFGATATGNPGQILEYRVTVTNTGGQAAQVKVTDAVPSYTTLVTHAGSYGTGTGTGLPANFIARVSDGANSVDLTMDGTDSEVQPLAPVETGFGDAAGTAATSPLNFWLGDTATNALGGKLPYCSNPAFTTQATCVGPASWITTLTILYQVKID